jgi:hypothetical protein
VPRALHRRLDRLARAHARQERRMVVLELDADRRDDSALVDRTLAGEGIVPGPEDLIIKLLRFDPPADTPPCALVRVGPLEGSAGGSR